MIEKSLRGIKSEKVCQDSALRDVPLAVESYPDMTYRVEYCGKCILVKNYELVLQYLHRVYGHIPVARLHNILEYYRVEEVIQYPGGDWRQIYPENICDMCLRTELKSVASRGLLDSGVFEGDHHTCNLQGPFSPAMITGNIYKFGILEYKTKHMKMYFVKPSSEVSALMATVGMNWHYTLYSGQS